MAKYVLKEREGVLNNLEQTGYQTTKPNQIGTQTLQKHKPRPQKNREPPQLKPMGCQF
jgi:hypothetical protein